jgi:hypothetical protein
MPQIRSAVEHSSADIANRKRRRGRRKRTEIARKRIEKNKQKRKEMERSKGRTAGTPSHRCCFCFLYMLVMYEMSSVG